MTRITPEMLVRGYAAGIFPMAEDANGSELYWVDPEKRGIIPIRPPRIPKRLRRTVRATPFKIRCNTDFAGVISGCAAPAENRPRTWINREIVELFSALHRSGLAHSVEVWHEGELVGGLYGLALNGVFFGESMFSRATDASKIALVHLMARLVFSGFQLLDAQFITEHLKQFGAVEIPRADYKKKLSRALAVQTRFQPDLPFDPLEVLQSITQIS